MTPIEKIRALRRLADRTTFPAEADSARSKASELMARHQIAEADLVAPPPAPEPIAAPPPPRHQVMRVQIIFTGNSTTSGHWTIWG